jgi:ABC-2 type transport system ATP-binding protein
MPPSPALSVRDLAIRYGNFAAVAGVSFDVAPGEAFGLVGPNGSGKSTTLAAVAAEIAPDRGEIRVTGLRERDAPLEYRRRIGFVPQELALYEELTVNDNLRFFARLYGLRGDRLARRVGEALATVGLGDLAGRRAGACSGGMKRRLNLACALVHEPAVLLLDEATVGLDAPSRAAVFDGLRRLRERGTAVVLTTHHAEEVDPFCDRVGVLDRGRLVACAAPARVPAGAAVLHGPHPLRGPVASRWAAAGRLGGDTPGRPGDR